MPPGIQKMVSGIKQPYGKGQAEPPGPVWLRFEKASGQTGGGQSPQDDVQTEVVEGLIKLHPIEKEARKITIITSDSGSFMIFNLFK